jgi:hypothetical protein
MWTESGISPELQRNDTKAAAAQSIQRNAVRETLANCFGRSRGTARAVKKQRKDFIDV